MSYEALTTADPNPIKRWIQRRRFADALKAHDRLQGTQALRLLDYGGGNGELLRQLATRGPLRASLYEPAPWFLKEARQRLAGVDGVEFFDNLCEFPDNRFDLVFCLEVFEHLPPAATNEAVGDIERLLKPGGRAVIGVPHELFAPAIVKGLFRMGRRYGEFDARPRHILAAAVGRPPSERPVAEAAPGFPYHFHHLGFDYRVLERQLDERFRMVRRWFSPLPWLGPVMNSEVYFLIEKPSVGID